MSSKDWKSYKLGDFAEVQNGYAFKANDFTDSGIPVIKIKNIVSSQIEFKDVRYYNGELSERLKQFLIKRNDVLISMTGSNVNQMASAVGKVGKYQFDYPALLNQRVGKVYIKNSKLGNHDYIYYFLNRFETQFELASRAGGSANQANISPTQIKNLPIILPPISTQKKIASILSSLDDKIELNRQSNQTLEAIAQALFKEWFVDFNFPGATGEMEESELGEIPKGWRIVQVGDVCAVNSKALSKKDSIDWIDYIEISEVNRGEIGEMKRYQFTEAPSRAKRKLLHGDIVISTVRPDRGAYFLALNPKPTTIASTGFAVFTSTKVPFSFLFLFLTDEKQLEYYGHVADGGAYPAINSSLIMAMNFVVPDQKILLKFHKIVEPVLDQIDLNRQQNQTLASLRDSLLPKLMKGEISLD